MTAVALIELCQRVRPELACLGELGEPLLAAVAVIERLCGARDTDVLGEPGFALDVLTAAGPVWDGGGWVRADRTGRLGA